MKILYLGQACLETTSRHRADALRRLGHDVFHFDPSDWLQRRFHSRWIQAFFYRTGYSLLQPAVVRKLIRELGGLGIFDVAWINGGDWFGPEAVRWIRQKAGKVLLYNNDDATGKRDWGRWRSLRRALSEYDLCVVPRQVNVPEYRSLGAANVLRVWMSYDEVQHVPYENDARIPVRFRTDVAFIGSWMEQRDELLLSLVERGIALRIWGNHWPSCPQYGKLRSFWGGSAVVSRDYVAAVQGAKICLGLLSKGNRDLHTRRSVEIPFANGLLCAERTTEHVGMYVEGEEALFWSTPEECAARCFRLLENEGERNRIRDAGRRKVLELNVGNEDVCRMILQELCKIGRDASLR